MAVANTKSTMITNADATPPVPTGSHICDGIVYEQVGYVEVAAADDDNSVYRFCRIPSNARISQLLIKNDAITGGTDYNVGFYDTAANGGAVITGGESAYADAIDLSSGRAVYTDLGQVIEENGEKRAWELTSLTADPKKDFDVCLKGITVGTGAGTVAVLVRYVI